MLLKFVFSTIRNLNKYVIPMFGMYIVIIEENQQ